MCRPTSTPNFRGRIFCEHLSGHPMSNRKWLCFACRVAIRRPVNAEKALCPACGQPCECIGHKMVNDARPWRATPHTP